MVIGLGGLPDSLEIAKLLIWMTCEVFKLSEDPVTAKDMWKANVVLEVAEREAEEAGREAEREAARALEQMKNTEP